MKEYIALVCFGIVVGSIIGFFGQIEIHIILSAVLIACAVSTWRTNRSRVEKISQMEIILAPVVILSAMWIAVAAKILNR